MNERDLLIRIGQATNIAVQMACTQKGSSVKVGDVTPDLVRECFHMIKNVGKVIYLEELSKESKVNIFTDIQKVQNLSELANFRNSNIKAISSLQGEEKAKLEEVVKNLLTRLN